jgi:indolepyruvate ferredoxin oxidoreductase
MDEIKALPQSTGKATWHFQPPFMRAMGLKKKLKLPFALAIPLMKLLSKGKILRGTKFDLFGYAKVRKTERLIRDRYIEEVMEALDCLTPENLTLILNLANLPEEVRGFEDLKLNSAGMFLDRLDIQAKEIIKHP